MTDKNSSKNIKRFLCLSFAAAMLFSAFPAVAEDDFWDEPMKIDAAAKSQQKAVTDQEFNKVINFFNKKKKNRKKKRSQKDNQSARRFRKVLLCLIQILLRLRMRLILPL